MKPVVKIFDAREEITLNTDTSEHLISGIWSQDHPIIYLSRCLTNAKFNYSNIEKEAVVDDY